MSFWSDLVTWIIGVAFYFRAGTVGIVKAIIPFDKRWNSEIAV